jgi:hypothetical protein
MDNQRDDRSQTTRTEPTTGDARQAQLDEFYLARLRRFAGLAAEAEGKAMRDLARYATLSAFRDCVARGLHDEARRLLDAAPVSEVIDPAA